jgi:mono/diheme cytochrome c family protein
MKRTGFRARAGGSCCWAAITILVAIGLGACADGGGSGSASASGAGSAGAESVESEPPGLPVGEPSGAIDQALSSQGEDLFTRRGCVACHKIGEGRLVGPDLAGVTDRRSFPWIYSMITNPDSMLQSDSTAQRLFGEYFTPMPNQKVQPEEAQALYEYLRARNK